MYAAINNLEVIILGLGIIIGLAFMKFQARTKKTDLIQIKAKKAGDNYQKVVEMILRREFRKEGQRQFDPIWVVDLEDEIIKAGLAAIDAVAGNTSEDLK